MQNISKFNIGIISIYPFPDAFGAATNRITAYSKGMTLNGAHIDVIVPFPTHNISKGETARKNEDSGIYNNISYYYPSGKYRHRYKVVRGFSILSKFRQFYGYYTSYRRIIRQNKLMQYDAIIISTDGIMNLLVYSMIAQQIKTLAIFIFDEYPVPIRHKLKEKIPFLKRFLYSIILKKINAFIAISEELKNYYTSICDRPTHILPIIIDTSRFEMPKAKNNAPNNDKYLCYMGNLELAKDDVDNIIKAFALIADDFKDVNLFLYGGPKHEAQKYLTQLIDKYGLQNRVFLKGKVPSDEVPDILNQAYVLVSSQPDTLRASGGFPTKLGEYLTTGIPTLITNVGENAKYVKDNVHMFFAPPGDHEAYAEKLKMILNNYSDALKVAKQGQEFVYDTFSHITTSRYLLEFISTLKQANSSQENE